MVMGNACHPPKRGKKMFKCTCEKNPPYSTFSLGHLIHTHGNSNQLHNKQMTQSFFSNFFSL